MNCERTSGLEGCLIFGIEIKVSIFNGTEPKKYQRVKKASAGNLFMSYFCQNISLKGLFLLPTQASMAQEPREPIKSAHCLLSRWFIYLFCQIVSKERHYQAIVIEHTHPANKLSINNIVVYYMTWPCVHSLYS